MAAPEFPTSPPSLVELVSADRPQLIKYWQIVEKTVLPKGLSQSITRRILAYEVQAQRQNDLEADQKARIGAMLKKKSTSKKNRKLAVGSQLLREWNGVLHSVEITPAGYLWNGKSYRSLTAVAEEITGAHWSGPRFFGLQSAKSGRTGVPR